MDCVKCHVKGCDGKLVIRSSRTQGRRKVEYLRCNKCGGSPEKPKRVTRRIDIDGPEMAILIWCKTNAEHLPEEIQGEITQLSVVYTTQCSRETLN